MTFPRLFIAITVATVAAISSTTAAQPVPRRLPVQSPQSAKTPSVTPQTFSYDDVQEAWKQVQVTKRPLLLFVSMDNCHFCEKMERETYAHPEISKGIRQLFVAARMKKEKAPELVQQLGIRAYPTTLLIAPSGDLISRIEGYADPKEFVLTIRPALAKHNQAVQRRTAAAPRPTAAASPRQ